MLLVVNRKFWLGWLLCACVSCRSTFFQKWQFYYRMPLDEEPNHSIYTSIVFLSPFPSWLIYLPFYCTQFLVYILCNPINLMVFLKKEINFFLMWWYIQLSDTCIRDTELSLCRHSFFLPRGIYFFPSESHIFQKKSFFGWSKLILFNWIASNHLKISNLCLF